MDAYISDFLRHLIAEKGFSLNTWNAYGNDLNQFHEFLKAKTNGSADGQNIWQTVDLALLKEHVADMRRRKGWRATTTARKIAAFKSFFRFLVLTGAVVEDPTEGMATPRVGQTLPRYLSEEEIPG